VTDLGLARISAVFPARFVERRKQLYDLYSQAFTADCIIVTPGLVESWHDAVTDRYVNTTPMIGGKLISDNRFSVRVLDYEQSYADLKATIETIKKRNAKAKFIVSLSPIPLRYTFTQKDIVTANNYSKAVLGTVCQELAKESSVDYFPSYEAAMYSRNVWESDRRHVSDRFVSHIIAELERRYFGDAEQKLPANFSMSFTNRIKRLIGLTRR
jgi:hypothetical protein